MLCLMIRFFLGVVSVCLHLLFVSSFLRMIISIAVCHPGLKMVYFAKAGWDADWIAAARKVITDLWLEHYKPVDDTNTAAPVRSFLYYF